MRFRYIYVVSESERGPTFDIVGCSNKRPDGRGKNQYCEPHAALHDRQESHPGDSSEASSVIACVPDKDAKSISDQHV